MTEQKTSESKEVRKVARAFLFQSISHEDLPEGISSVDFTRTIQIKKNKASSNPGQVMAIGGGVEKGETPEGAIKREVLQETGVIMSDFTRLKTEQEYFYQHKTKGTKQNQATFFIGNLYPHGIDIPYVLDNETDKIEKFEYFTTHDLYLWFLGKEERRILDSLEPRKKIREKENTVTDSKVVKQIRIEVLKEAYLAEIKKKISVIEKVYQFKSVKVEDKKVFETVEDLRNLDYRRLKEKYKEINKYWAELVQKTDLTKSELGSILRFANVEEVLLDMGKTYEKGKIKHGEGFMIPTFAMMFPLLFGLNFDEKLLYLINNSPIFKKFYFIARMLGILNQIRKMSGKDCNLV